MTIKYVYLMLGQACNFKCKHCIQNGVQTSIKKHIDPKVIEYLKKIAKSQKNKAQLFFWGGEPLLYREMIKQAAQELYGLFELGMVSNGSLLNEEDVEILNKYDIKYVYSNDGKNTCMVRDKNMFEDKRFLELFSQVKNKAVEGVIHAMNQDCYEFWDYVDEYFPQTPAYLGDIYCVQGIPKSYTDYDFEKFIRTHKRLEEDILSGVETEELNRPCVYMSTPIFTVENPNASGRKLWCSACVSVLDIDVNGKIYICHNSDQVIGTIDEDLKDVHKRGLKVLEDLMTIKMDQKKCGDCSVKQYCRGACPFEIASPIQENACKARKIYWTAAENIVSEFRKRFSEHSQTDE